MPIRYPVQESEPRLLKQQQHIATLKAEARASPVGAGRVIVVRERRMLEE
jgi:hypothetical protein